MLRRLLRTFVMTGVCVGALVAQTPSRPFPAKALDAKTVAIINETGNHDVEKGAVSALEAWGQFRIIDDPEQADIMLHFLKNRTHEGTSTQKTEDNGQTSSSYSMSFGSSIRMTASVKDASGDFYSTKTDDGKAKAGTSCVNDFHTAFRNAMQQRTRPPATTP